MVWISKGGLKTGRKMSGILMVRLIMWSDHFDSLQQVLFDLNFCLSSAQFTSQSSLKQRRNMSRNYGSYANFGLTCRKLHSLACITKPHFTPASFFSDSGHRQVEHGQCGGVPGHLSHQRRLGTTRSRTSSSLNIVQLQSVYLGLILHRQV